jgi:hypothetical protein
MNGLPWSFGSEIAAQPFRCSVLVDEGPYRLERGGVRDEFILPLWFETGRRRMIGQGVEMNALKYSSGNHYPKHVFGCEDWLVYVTQVGVAVEYKHISWYKFMYCHKHRD